jgi:Flp pilus assembly protein TadG
MKGLIMQPMSFRSIRDEVLRDERGTISIEFMIVMPLLLFLTISGLGFWDAFQSNSKTAKIAYTVSDIMSRYDVVDDTDMTYLYAVQDKMLSPDLDRRSLRISSICFEDGIHRVLWSYTASSADIVDPGALTDEDIPLEILPAMAPQDSVILTELEARWQPHFNVGIGSRMWRSELVTRPRFVKIIPHTTLNPSNICPSGA